MGGSVTKLFPAMVTESAQTTKALLTVTFPNTMLTGGRWAADEDDTPAPAPAPVPVPALPGAFAFDEAEAEAEAEEGAEGLFASAGL